MPDNIKKILEIAVGYYLFYRLWAWKLENLSFKNVH